MHSKLNTSFQILKMSDFHKPDKDDDDDDDDNEEYSEEEEEINLEMIKAKFSSLSSALQETNQNLVTIEMLQDHYRCIYRQLTQFR